MPSRFLRILSFSLLAILLAMPVTALARIKLITLPVRQRVEIQLDNPQATLVEEERIVPLVKGVNQVDFSWANTQIDPNSIIFRVIPQVLDGAKEKTDKVDKVIPERIQAREPSDGQPLDVKVLSVSYPPNEASLVWQVASSGSGSARVRISYILGNLVEELQLPSRDRERRKNARFAGVHAAAKLRQRGIRVNGNLCRFRSPLPKTRWDSTRPRKSLSKSSRACPSKRHIPAIQPSSTTLIDRRTSSAFPCTMC